MLQRRIGMICTRSGCAVWTRPRTNSFAERALRLMVVSEANRPIIARSSACRLRGRTQLPNLIADLQRAGENRPDRDEAEQLVTGDGGEAGGRDAAALRAIRGAAVLTRRDLRLQIGGDGHRRLREDAVVG